MTAYKTGRLEDVCRIVKLPNQAIQESYEPSIQDGPISEDQKETSTFELTEVYNGTVYDVIVSTNN